MTSSIVTIWVEIEEIRRINIQKIIDYFKTYDDIRFDSSRFQRIEVW